MTRPRNPLLTCNLQRARILALYISWKEKRLSLYFSRFRWSRRRTPISRLRSVSTITWQGKSRNATMSVPIRTSIMCTTSSRRTWRKLVRNSMPRLKRSSRNSTKAASSQWRKARCSSLTRSTRWWQRTNGSVLSDLRRIREHITVPPRMRLSFLRRRTSSMASHSMATFCTRWHIPLAARNSLADLTIRLEIRSLTMPGKSWLQRWVLPS